MSGWRIRRRRRFTVPVRFFVARRPPVRSGGALAAASRSRNETDVEDSPEARGTVSRLSRSSTAGRNWICRQLSRGSRGPTRQPPPVLRLPFIGRPPPRSRRRLRQLASRRGTRWQAGSSDTFSRATGGPSHGSRGFAVLPLSAQIGHRHREPSLIEAALTDICQLLHAQRARFGFWCNIHPDPKNRPPPGNF